MTAQGMILPSGHEVSMAVKYLPLPDDLELICEALMGDITPCFDADKPLTLKQLVELDLGLRDGYSWVLRTDHNLDIELFREKVVLE